MSAYLGTSPIFELEGIDGTCQLFSDELGYSLYFEDNSPECKPIIVKQYAVREGVIEDAFKFAKFCCGLDDWNMNWFSFMMNEKISDWEEWDDMIEHLSTMFGDNK